MFSSGFKASMSMMKIVSCIARVVPFIKDLKILGCYDRLLLKNSSGSRRPPCLIGEFGSLCKKPPAHNLRIPALVSACMCFGSLAGRTVLHSAACRECVVVDCMFLSPRQGIA
jgi:hypothetical protein